MKQRLVNQAVRRIYKIASTLIAAVLCLQLIVPPPHVLAQGLLQLPMPGTLVQVTPAFHPAIIRGMTIHPDNPFAFDFMIDPGQSGLQDQSLNDEASKLMRYFLAALTVPEQEMWVNLSPYEKNRIIPDTLRQTEMGRDLLAQDYLLKQLSASLMYPEDELGQRFWKRVRARAQKEFGTTDIPMNTFNKVWIVPDTAKIYIHDNNVFVADSHLKVMIEEDYLALERNSLKGHTGDKVDDVVTGLQSEIVREILIPEIEREVNEGELFANLRQIYHSMILATWYKTNLKNSVLSQVYVDQNKVEGVDVDDPQVHQKIYDQYVEAFKRGVYNYIKEDLDEESQQVVPRQYFAGGVAFDQAQVSEVRSYQQIPTEGLLHFQTRIDAVTDDGLVRSDQITQETRSQADKAMTAWRDDDYTPPASAYTADYSIKIDRQSVELSDSVQRRIRLAIHSRETVPGLVERGRSLIFPLDPADYFEVNGRTVRGLRLKGVTHRGFPPVMLPYDDSQNPRYRQSKNVMIITKTDAGAEKVTFRKAPEQPTGTIRLNEAQVEFETLRQIQQVPLRTIRTDIPVGVGEFTGLQFDGEPTGFVIMGLEQLYPHERLGTAFEKRYNRRPASAEFYADIMRGRYKDFSGHVQDIGQTVGRLHRLGIIHTRLHLDQFSTDESGRIKIYDFEDALMSRDMSEDEYVFRSMRDFFRMLTNIGQIDPFLNYGRKLPSQFYMREYFNGLSENTIERIGYWMFSSRQEQAFIELAEDFNSMDRMEASPSLVAFLNDLGRRSEMAAQYMFHLRRNYQKITGLTGDAAMLSLDAESWTPRKPFRYAKLISERVDQILEELDNHPFRSRRMFIRYTPDHEALVTLINRIASTAPRRRMEILTPLMDQMAKDMFQLGPRFDDQQLEISRKVGEGLSLSLQDALTNVAAEYGDAESVRYIPSRGPENFPLYDFVESLAEKSREDLRRIAKELVELRQDYIRLTQWDLKHRFPKQSSIKLFRGTRLNQMEQNRHLFYTDNPNYAMNFGSHLIVADVPFEKIEDVWWLAAVLNPTTFEIEFLVAPGEFSRKLGMAQSLPRMTAEINEYIKLSRERQLKIMGSTNVYGGEYRRYGGLERDDPITQADVDSFAGKFLSADGELLSEAERRAKKVWGEDAQPFGITEVFFIPEGETRDRMSEFQARLKDEFGDLVYMVEPENLHLTTQGLERQWQNKSQGTTRPYGLHQGLEQVHPGQPELASIIDKAKSIATPPVQLEVSRLNYHPRTGIYWEVRPYLHEGQTDPIQYRRDRWGLPVSRPPHITAAYFTREFSSGELARLQKLLREYADDPAFGNLHLNRLDVIAYTDFSFNAGTKTLHSIELDESEVIDIDLEAARQMGFVGSVQDDTFTEGTRAYGAWFLETLNAIEERMRIVLEQAQLTQLPLFTYYLDGFSNAMSDGARYYQVMKSYEEDPDPAKKLIWELGGGNTRLAERVARYQKDNSVYVVTTDAYINGNYTDNAKLWKERRLAAQQSGLENLAVVRATADMLLHIPDDSLDELVLVQPAIQILYDLAVLFKEYDLSRKFKRNGRVVIKIADSFDKMLPVFPFAFQITKQTDFYGADLLMDSQWQGGYLGEDVYIATINPWTEHDEAMSRPVRTLDLPMDIKAALQSAEIMTFAQILEQSEADLLALPGIGPAYLNRIKTFVENDGYFLADAAMTSDDDGIDLSWESVEADGFRLDEISVRDRDGVLWYSTRVLDANGEPLGGSSEISFDVYPELKLMVGQKFYPNFPYGDQTNSRRGRGRALFRQLFTGGEFAGYDRISYSSPKARASLFKLPEFHQDPNNPQIVPVNRRSVIDSEYNRLLGVPEFMDAYQAFVDTIRSNRAYALMRPDLQDELDKELNRANAWLKIPDAAMMSISAKESLDILLSEDPEPTWEEVLADGYALTQPEITHEQGFRHYRMRVVGADGQVLGKGWSDIAFDVYPSMQLIVLQQFYPNFPAADEEGARPGRGRALFRHLFASGEFAGYSLIAHATYKARQSYLKMPEFLTDPDQPQVVPLNTVVIDNVDGNRLLGVESLADEHQAFIEQIRNQDGYQALEEAQRADLEKSLEYATARLQMPGDPAMTADGQGQEIFDTDHVDAVVKTWRDVQADGYQLKTVAHSFYRGINHRQYAVIDREGRDISDGQSKIMFDVYPTLKLIVLEQFYPGFPSRSEAGFKDGRGRALFRHIFDSGEFDGYDIISDATSAARRSYLKMPEYHLNPIQPQMVPVSEETHIDRYDARLHVTPGLSESFLDFMNDVRSSPDYQALGPGDRSNIERAFVLATARLRVPIRSTAGVVQGESAMAQDSAMITADATKGGIDLDSVHLELTVDGDPVTLNLDALPLSIPAEQIRGFVPVIIHVTPITNMPFLLGMETEAEPTEGGSPDDSAEPIQRLSRRDMNVLRAEKFTREFKL